jgi:hypothetical protein
MLTRPNVPGLEIQLAQHAYRAHGHGVMDVVIKAHGLETLPQSGLRRHTTDAQGCGEEIAVLELPYVVETYLANSDETAKAPQNFLLSDLIVRGLPLGAGGVDVADAHEFAIAASPALPMIGSSVISRANFSMRRTSPVKDVCLGLRAQYAKIFHSFQLQAAHAKQVELNLLTVSGYWKKIINFRFLQNRL